MGIRTLCAAAAVVVGVGSAADAATYFGTFTLVSAIREYEAVYHGDPHLPDVVLPSYWGVATGDTVSATITVTDSPGGVLFGISTAGGMIFDSPLSLAGGVYRGFEKGDEWGWEGLTWDGGMAGTIDYYGDMRPWFPVVKGTFTLAPVPLPAPAALLPIGIGALALMRRRRRLA